MVAWLIYEKKSAVYNRGYIDFYIEEGKKLGILVKLILIEDLEFGVRNHQWFLSYRGTELERPDFAIIRVIYPLLSKHLEYMGIKVFNNSFVSEICNDKARTYQYLAKTGIPMVDTSFYRNVQVKEVLEKINQPSVVKAVDGHGGSQVFLYEPENMDPSLNSNIGSNKSLYRNPNFDSNMMDLDQMKQREDIQNGLKGSDLVVQPLIGSKNQDLRVYVIGKEIIASVLRTAKKGFRSNFSLGGEVHLYELSHEERTIVNTIIDQFDFGLVGIDFLIGDEGELIFNEIEDVVGSRMLYHCSDINIVKLYLEYIVKCIS